MRVCKHKLAAGSVLLAMAMAAAQGGEVRGVVRGTDAGAFVMVELQPTGGQVDGFHRAHVRIGMEFVMREVRGGSYWLRVTSEHGAVLQETPVAVQGPVTTVEAVIRERRKEVGGGEAISAKRLRHEVPKGARKEFGRYWASREKGDLEEAEEHLEKALALDGEFVEAWVNLGALHTRRKQWAQAAAEFERALAIDPACAVAWANRAFVYLHQGDAAAAERAAKTALRYEPGNEKTQYLLQMARWNQGKK